MSNIAVNGSNLGTTLTNMLMCDEIEPGSSPSYQICKEIYLYHPLGAKMAESPIRMAQSQQRDIAIPKSPESRVKDAFLKEWKALGADKTIFNTMRQARAYGISSVALIVDGVTSDKQIDYRELWKLSISFNVFDPLNTAGSLVLNQIPNASDYQKSTGIVVDGQRYHRSRACVVMNEEPIYIAYTTSAFGYVGRSVYQRALYPMKSFVQSMITDDMVTRKAGLLVAMMKTAGSVVDNIMNAMAGIKRKLLKEAQTNNVISIGETEKIETLNMQNTDVAMNAARKNILENIAVSADMPAILINSETFAEGFGEGTEDAKNVARYVDRMREEMGPLYAFFDLIVQYRAWNPEFYKIIQAEFPEEYAGVPFTRAFYDWSNSFTAIWPNLLTEPDSEKAKTEDVKLKAIVEVVKTLMPAMDPVNKAALVQWAADNINDNRIMFSNPLVIDIEALASYVPPAPVIGSDETDDSDTDDTAAKNDSTTTARLVRHAAA